MAAANTNEAEANEGTEETSEEKKKVRAYSSPRCVLCVALMGSAKAYQTSYSCRTCGVYLCIALHGSSKKTCFEKWHAVKELASLKKNNSVNPGPLRTSPRKKPKPPAQSGSMTTSEGVRRSMRKRSVPPSNKQDC